MHWHMGALLARTRPFRTYSPEFCSRRDRSRFGGRVVNQAQPKTSLTTLSAHLLAPALFRREPRLWAELGVQGRLSGLERQSGRTLAEVAGDVS